MREIKFRGREKESNKWVFGYARHWKCCYGDEWHIQGENDNVHIVIPATVGQFTGLLDSNGKEIYEGDIVRCKRDDWADDDAEVYAVEYFADLDYPAFELDGWTDESNGLSYFRFEGTLEVIGNVHDNPNLMEAAHD